MVNKKSPVPNLVIQTSAANQQPPQAAQAAQQLLQNVAMAFADSVFAANSISNVVGSQQSSVAASSAIAKPATSFQPIESPLSQTATPSILEDQYVSLRLAAKRSSSR